MGASSATPTGPRGKPAYMSSRLSPWKTDPTMNVMTSATAPWFTDRAVPHKRVDGQP